MRAVDRSQRVPKRPIKRRKSHKKAKRSQEENPNRRSQPQQHNPGRLEASPQAFEEHSRAILAASLQLPQQPPQPKREPPNKLLQFYQYPPTKHEK